ncbi:outer membrane lipid asymmetry maintenance protein MlaD [Alphaproteobacteria bacterium]|nr:outer membrane lipid asymmetry maintenance protein MlaD [Alphaproteobacteria bacterium]
MKNNTFEAIIGALVLILAVIFLFYSFSIANVGKIDGYELSADFDRIDGLVVGSDVRMSGIKIGTVIEESLDPNTYLANIKIRINSSILIPIDSSAQIISDGLLGNKFLSITPGGDSEFIEEGGKISLTQSSIILENLIAQFMFGTNNKKDDKE